MITVTHLEENSVGVMIVVDEGRFESQNIIENTILDMI